VDSHRFDTLARALGRSVSRRGAVGVLVGALALRGEVVSSLAKGPAPKELVCHKGKTRKIAASAVQAHLDHGDTRGPCREEGTGTCAHLGSVCDGSALSDACCDAGANCFHAAGGSFVCTLPCAESNPTPDAFCQLALSRKDVYCSESGQYRCNALPEHSCCLPCQVSGGSCLFVHDCCPGLACTNGTCQ
jgi:hypothetical protein